MVNYPVKPYDIISLVHNQTKLDTIKLNSQTNTQGTKQTNTILLFN